MAGYTLLRSGSTGEDVKKLQNALIGAGYDVGKSGADGIYGANTESAVRKYQQDNGLSVDGIAGDMTLGRLYGNSEQKSGFVPTRETYGFNYTPYQESDNVAKAQAMLQQQMAQKPGEYQSQWQDQLNDTIDRILNREKFSYDINNDALYQQYKDQYTRLGKMSMLDTMGQAQAMTGGYGNSYSQSVGQQAYNDQLSKLNDVVPELYQMALDKYNQEGQDLYNQYAMLGDRENLDYSRYQDALNRWYTDRDYLQNRYDTERDYDYEQYMNDLNTRYQMYRDQMSDEQWQKEFDLQNSDYSSGSGRSGSSGGSSSGSESWSGGYDNGGLSDSQVKALQKALGVTADGMYGSQSKKAAGGLSAKEAYEKYVVGGEQEQNVQQETGVQQEPAGFTGTTYNEAVAYMKNNGVPNAKASNLMTSSEWSRRRDSYKRTGVGGTEVKNYNSYAEYIADFVEYAIESYGK